MLHSIGEVEILTDNHGVFRKLLVETFWSRAVHVEVQAIAWRNNA